MGARKAATVDPTDIKNHRRVRKALDRIRASSAELEGEDLFLTANALEWLAGIAEGRDATPATKEARVSA